MNGDQWLDEQETMEIGVKTGFKQGFQAGYATGYEKGKTSQKAVLDKIRTEIEGITSTYHNADWSITDLAPISEVLKIIDKYKAESEVEE